MFYDVAVNGDNVWFYNIFFNAIFRVDLKTKKIAAECYFDIADKDKQFMQYMAMAYYDNKLIIAPRNAGDIIIYDLSSKECTKIPIDLSGTENVFNLFSNIRIYKDSAYIFPGRYKAIVKLDLKTYETEYIDDWYKSLGGVDNEDSVTIENVKVCGDNICMMPCWQKNAVIEFNMDTKEHKIHTVPVVENDGLADIVFDGDNYWISMKLHSDVIKWDGGTEFSVIKNTEFSGGFKNILQNEEYIYCIPLCGDRLFKINKQTNCLECDRTLISEPTEEMREITVINCNVMCCKMLDSERGIIYSTYDGKVIVFNAKTGEYNTFLPQIAGDDEKQFKKYFSKILLENVIFENVEFGLWDMLDCIKFS